MKNTITGADFKNMILNAAAAIERNKQPVNDLNVFPVPDGDTGTNMSLTMANAAAEMRKLSASMPVGKVSEKAAGALLRGARGNSGVILSLLFRGISRSLRELTEASPTDFARALSDGVETAYKAVMKPAEGTILTVSRLSAASAAECAENGGDVEAVFESLIAESKVALDDTINLNPVLKKAGVIDSGGKGYVIIMEAMLAALRGEVIEEAPAEAEDAAGEKRKEPFSVFETSDITFAYCTEFIVQRENAKDPQLLWGFLAPIGDSAVIVDDDEIIKVHVHTNCPGVVITEALTYGSLLTVKIENMREQHTEILEVKAGEEPVKRSAAPEKKFGCVAVCAGKGMEALFSDIGADRVVTGGQTMNPSTDDILEQIDLTPAEIVYVFPNNKNIIMAAEQCVSLSDKTVVIIPTKTVPQGVSALLAFDPELSEEECTAAMLAAAENVRTAQVTYASRDSDFDGREISAGDFLVFYEGALVGTGRSFEEVYSILGEAFKAAPFEMVSVFYGCDVSEEEAEKCVASLSALFPDADITAVNGGQPVYYYMISIE